jgi:hypothetical protein
MNVMMEFPAYKDSRILVAVLGAGEALHLWTTSYEWKRTFKIWMNEVVGRRGYCIACVARPSLEHEPRKAAQLSSHYVTVKFLGQSNTLHDHLSFFFFSMSFT